MVFEDGVSVYLAAKILNINYSTAKAIAKKQRRIAQPKVKKNLRAPNK